MGANITKLKQETQPEEKAPNHVRKVQTFLYQTSLNATIEQRTESFK